MKQIRLPVAFLAVTAAASAQAFDVPRPPAVLSPDLTQPWVVQIGTDQANRLPRQGTQPAPAAAPAVQPQTTVAAVDPANYRIDPIYLPQTVPYTGAEPPGTIIVDTPNKFLYLILPNNQARRYGVGVGRPGFEWAGVHTVTRMAEWPDWRPPDEMRERVPGLPTFMAGGINNPLGARALYLGSTLYRIHGSNEPWTIGMAVSSGCIRMRNEDVVDLYNRVSVGTRVIVI
jgi:lipoprotein-anchoring transpeptidase ErfK/SrfK